MVPDPKPTMKCLTLMASRGFRSEWDDVAQSLGHRAIPLPDLEAVQKIPMIAQLMRGLGVDVVGLLESDRPLLIENRHTGVFFVPEAEGSPYIPAQAEFVKPFGVRSVIGFGDVLPDGNMFALICFSKVPVTQSSAELLSHLSLSTRVAIVPHLRTLADPLAEMIRSQQHLLENYEEIVMQQQKILQMALQETHRANELKGEFLANMSHEIRTPMTAILGFSEMLSNDIDFVHEEAKAYEAVQTIHRNASHLLAIINDILDMSKIEAGKMQVELIEVDPIQILEETVSFVRPQAIEKRLDVTIDYLTRIPQKIQTDPTRLRQILVNLAGNAVKFTSQGGIFIRVSADPVNSQMTFDVVDSGVGMTPEQLAIISKFDLFSQADTSTTRRFGGTGLGLSICNSLAPLLGGELTIRSEFGIGSTFSLTIETGHQERLRVPSTVSDLLNLDANDVNPLYIDLVQGTSKAANNASVIDASDLAPRLPLDGKRILLAEDGPDNQRLIAHYMRKAGAEIEILDNGLLLIERFERLLTEGVVIDLILMDMQMPVMDGYEATRQLRRKGYNIPVVALTANAMASDRERCLAAGCDDYATKPISPMKLVATCVALVS